MTRESVAVHMRSGKEGRGRHTSFKIVGLVLLILYTVLILVPFIWAMSVSLKSFDGFIMDPLGFPKEMKFSNYVDAFRLLKVDVKYANGTSATMYMWNLLLNSVLYSVGCAFMFTLAPCLMSYVVAHYKFKFNKVIYMLVIIKLVLPIVGNLPSEIQVARTLGLYDTLIGAYIMKFTFLGTNFLIFLSIFRGLSWGYAEAAFMDGASHFKVFTRIMLPLVRTTFGTLMLLSFISFWNDYYTPMIYLPSMPTVAYGLYYYQTSATNALSTVPMQLSSCMIVSAPILLIFLVFRKKMMGSLTIGGLKG